MTQSQTGQQLAKVDQFKQQLNANYRKAIENYFQDEDKARRFLTSVSTSVQNNPKLLECNQTSLMNAFLCCAELGLYPSNVAGEAYVIPYKGTAQFQLGVQGAITLAYRAGIKALWTEIIYANDHFRQTLGLNPNIEHEPVELGKDKGEPVGVYAVAILESGEKVFKILSKDDVMKVKAKSQAGDSGPWNPEQDPFLGMWRKTAIKQLYKVLPKNETIKKSAEMEAGAYKVREIAKDSTQESTEISNTFTEPPQENKDEKLQAQYDKATNQK